jgi:hypothetical protein
MTIGIEHIAPLLPETWPGRELAVMPGDLGFYVTAGFGAAAPLIVRPWEKLETLERQQGYYDLDAEELDPILGAPSSEPSGGCVYFDDDIDSADLLAVLRVMGVNGGLRDYVLFGAESTQTPDNRYLDQIRIVSRGALTHLFNVPIELVGDLAKPAAELATLIPAFVAAQREKWNDPRYAFGGKLAGSLGGDGDWAKESLAFGFLMENQYWQVMRLWSRPWLVTK